MRWIIYAWELITAQLSKLLKTNNLKADLWNIRAEAQLETKWET